MHKSTFWLLLIFMLLMPVADATGGPHRADRHPGFVQAHHAYNRKKAAYTSPDGLYIARVSFEDGEVKDEDIVLTISRKGSKRPAFATFGGVEGFTWVPHRRHTLVVSTDGGHNGTGKLAVWTDTEGPRTLMSGQELEDDNFNIKRVSQDGKKVIYEHFGYDVDERHPEHGSGPHELFLPPS